MSCHHLQNLESFLLKANEEKEKGKRASSSSPAVVGFWYGKLLRSLEIEDDHVTSKEDGGVVTTILGVPIHEHVEEGREWLAKCHTSLSPHVHYLITQSLPIDRCRDDYLDDNLTLDWSLLKNYFDSSSSDYIALVQQLGVVAASVHATLQNKDVVLEKWKPLFNWTHSPQVYVDCFELLFSDNNHHLSLTLLTAAVERSLGDVYLQVSNASICPRHMKDLLATEELNRLLGAEPMFCLKGLIGPPGGLNLRNVVWHGFAGPDEIPKQYVTLVLVLVASLGKIIQKTLDCSMLTHRSCVSFDTHEKITNNRLPHEYSVTDLEQVIELFKDSFFIIPSMLPIWRSAITQYKNQRYGHCLCLLLPALEHSLRRVFACCNGCHERILTAESTTLYTTLDEILSPVLEDGYTVNVLPEEIGHKNMEMLMDILVYPEGPKLRDRISHGEVDLSITSQALAGHVLSMCVSHSLQYSINFKPVKGSIIEKVREDGEVYVSLFHPLPILRRELVCLMEELDEWKEMEKICSTGEENHDDTLLVLSSRLHINYTSALRVLMDSFSDSRIPDSHASDLHTTLSVLASVPSCFHGNSALVSLIETVWGIPHRTLFSNRHKMETIGLLRRIINHLTTAVKQIISAVRLRYNLYLKKELRSRQRKNFDRLLSCIGSYWSSVALSITLVCLTVTRSHDQSHDQSCDCTKMTKFLKKVLQFCENFSSQTSPEKNRWEESDKLCSEYIKFIISSIYQSCSIYVHKQNVFINYYFIIIFLQL